jgi:hypothetical protein
MNSIRMQRRDLLGLPREAGETGWARREPGASDDPMRQSIAHPLLDFDEISVLLYWRTCKRDGDRIIEDGILLTPNTIQRIFWEAVRKIRPRIAAAPEVQQFLSGKPCKHSNFRKRRERAVCGAVAGGRRGGV